MTTRLTPFLLLLVLKTGCVDVGGSGALARSRTPREADEDECVLNLTVSGSGGTLTSPNFPSKYPSNADCRWLLTAEDPNATLLLRIDSLAIEPHPACKLDFLQVYLGSSTLAPSIGPFCGNVNDRVLKTNSSNVLLLFHSDPVYEDKGFSIDYFTQNAGDCQASVGGVSGVVRSPGFPANYPDGADCWTVVSAGEEQRLQLTFDSLDLEHGDNCSFDFVRIYDGASRESPLLGQLCRQQSASTFESSSSSLLIHFHSDESVNKKGYRARFMTVDKRSVITGACEWESEEKKGTLASPNYPSHYPSGSNCSVWLQAPRHHAIHFAIDALLLELDANCSYDFLRITDETDHGSKEMGTFCGRKSEPKNLTSTSNKARILFQSDDFGEFSGFKLRYWFQSNDTEEEETAAEPWTPSEEAAFETVPQNATLPLGSPYMLHCSTRNPLAKIRWLKDEYFLAGANPLPGLKALTNGSLWIPRMEGRLTGQYTCVVVSEQRTLSSTAFVRLQAGQAANDSDCGIVFRKVPRDSSYAEGEFAHLECLAAGAGVSVSWEKDGSPLGRPSNGSSRLTILPNGFLFLEKVSVEDAGVYTCVARDENAACSRRANAVLSVSKRADVSKICGIPRLGKPSEDVPLMEHGKIVGGHDTKKGAYPWQAMLWEPHLQSFCGGSLLNERWVATAAHCFANYAELRWEQVQVRLGRHDRELPREEGEVRSALADPSSVVLHPAYNKATFDNDLALVRLRDHVRFSDHVLPVCVPDGEGAREGGVHLGTVTGWGKLKEHGPSPRFLQEIRLPLVDRATCVASTNYSVSRNMFCAGYAQEILGDACHGDSGGPFLTSENNRWYLTGIVSWGEGCGKANKYGFYTKIANYLPWIKGIIKS